MFTIFVSILFRWQQTAAIKRKDVQPTKNGKAEQKEEKKEEEEEEKEKEEKEKEEEEEEEEEEEKEEEEEENNSISVTNIATHPQEFFRSIYFFPESVEFY